MSKESKKRARQEIIKRINKLFDFYHSKLVKL
jgi:hypothetical protein